MSSTKNVKTNRFCSSFWNNHRVVVESIKKRVPDCRKTSLERIQVGKWKTLNTFKLEPNSGKKTNKNLRKLSVKFASKHVHCYLVYKNIKHPSSYFLTISLWWENHNTSKVLHETNRAGRGGPGLAGNVIEAVLDFATGGLWASLPAAVKKLFPVKIRALYFILGRLNWRIQI